VSRYYPWDLDLHSFNGLQAACAQWAEDRQIIQHGTLVGQATKLVEEANETLDAVKKLTALLQREMDGDRVSERDALLAELKDGIGDVMVVVIVICRMAKLHPVLCLRQAYLEIQNRTGKMNSDGIFVKDEEQKS